MPFSIKLATICLVIAIVLFNLCRNSPFFMPLDFDIRKQSMFYPKEDAPPWIRGPYERVMDVSGGGIIRYLEEFPGIHSFENAAEFSMAYNQSLVSPCIDICLKDKEPHDRRTTAYLSDVASLPEAELRALGLYHVPITPFPDSAFDIRDVAGGPGRTVHFDASLLSLDTKPHKTQTAAKVPFDTADFFHSYDPTKQILFDICAFPQIHNACLNQTHEAYCFTNYCKCAKRLSLFSV